MPLILAVRSLRKDRKCEANLGYIVISCLKETQYKKMKERIERDDGGDK